MMKTKKDKNNMNVSEYERNNRVSMLCHFIVIICMELLATLRCASGLCSVSYYLFTLVLGFFSPIAEYICWEKNHETRMISHFVGYGFAVYFTFVIFTSSDAMLFYFVVPLLLVISVYNDVAYSLKVNIGVVIESFLITIIGGMTGRFGFSTLSNAIIQDIVIIMIAVFSYWVAKTINANSRLKLDKINSMMDATDQGLVLINRDLNTLLESATRTRNAMEQVSSGTNNTTEAVQSQLLQTAAISEKTALVEQAVNMIDSSMKQTIQCVEQGREDLRNLINIVDETVESSKNMATFLEDLQVNMSEMNKISKMIDSIAFQTNILALNANVEAARAGSAGKGFAVVAGEVSAMSHKTKDSNEEISCMITNISATLNDITNGIKKISKEISTQKESVKKSENSFASIEKNTVSVNDNINTLINTVNELTTANHGIADSIETISAVSEEVAALASEAMNQEFENTNVLNHIAQAAGELSR